MNYVKYAVWAVVAWFLYKLFLAKKAGMSTPDALRSQIPWVGDFLAKAAEHPPTTMTGASSASVDVPSQAPGWSIDVPSDLVSHSSNSIMNPAPSRFVPDNTPHPIVMQSFDTGAFTTKAAPVRPIPLVVTRSEVASFTAPSTGGAQPARAPMQVTSQQRLWIGLGASSPVNKAAAPSSLAAGAKGIFG